MPDGVEDPKAKYIIKTRRNTKQTQGMLDLDGQSRIDFGSIPTGLLLYYAWQGVHCCGLLEFALTAVHLEN